MGKKVFLIRQLGTTDCGIACLAMIYKYYGYDIGINELKSRSEVGRDGMSLADMKALSEDLGFIFHAYYDYLNEENLQKLLPAILITNNNHYVVVSEYVEGDYTILNPETGISKVKFDVIEKEYLKKIINISPKSKITLKRKKHRFFDEKPKITFKFDKVKFIGAIFLTIMTQTSMLMPSFIVGDIVDEIKFNEMFNFYKYFILMIFIALMFYLSNILRKRLVLIIQTDMYLTTIEKMIDKIFKIDLSFFENHLSGDLEGRFNSVNELYEFISVLFLNMAIDLFTAIICGVLIFVKSKIIFFLIIFLGGIQVFLINNFNKKAREGAVNFLADKNILEGKMVEILSNIQQIRCMRIDRIIRKNLKNSYVNLVSKLKERDNQNAILESIVGAFSILLTLSIYLMGGVIVSKNIITVGSLVSIVALSSYFIKPFQSISLIIPQLNMLGETIIRLEELIKYKDNLNNGEIFIDRFENIRFNNVSFSYYGNKENNLSDLNFNIKKGEKIAIVGESGSGKTTLIKLILSVFSRYSGEILINNIDVGKIKKSSIDNIFSIVTQIPLAISGNIKENIDFNNSKSSEEIKRILEIVELKKDIEKLPMGINTNIGEGGQNISGGQKQRLAIARALATSPQVLILDEATSNLDSITEKRIFKNLNKMSVTLIIITHRLSSIKDADKIFVLKDGRIIEEGDHQKLMMKEKSFYKRMVENYES